MKALICPTCQWGDLRTGHAGACNREAPTVIRSGSEALLVYPEGDVDTVTVVSLRSPAATGTVSGTVEVRLPSGELLTTVPEDIGIGVDDELVAQFDDEPTPQERLEHLRGQIEAEQISYGEIAELQGLAEHIDPSDVVLRQWAGLPEQADPVQPERCTHPTTCTDTHLGTPAVTHGRATGVSWAFPHCANCGITVTGPALDAWMQDRKTREDAAGLWPTAQDARTSPSDARPTPDALAPTQPEQPAATQTGDAPMSTETQSTTEPAQYVASVITVQPSPSHVRQVAMYRTAINGREVWPGGKHSAAYVDEPGGYERVLARAEAFAALLTQEARLRPQVARLARLPKLPTRDDILAAGYAPAWDGRAVWVGDVVVVHARGGWRRGVVTKVTKAKVTAAVATPSDPELITYGTGDRTGKYHDLYVMRGTIAENAL